MVEWAHLNSQSTFDRNLRTSLGMDPKGNEIIALFNQPKSRIKPQFDGRKPGLQIELETQGYQAIASVQPFKNNRN